MTRVIGSSADAEKLIGEDLGVSEGVLIDQRRIDTFAEATGDFQWIHVDAVRAAAGPFGSTIAHGYLTLSLLPRLASQVYSLDFGTARLNYGSNKVRFPSPVPVGSVLRATPRIVDVRRAPQGTYVTTQVTIQADGAAKPACVVEAVALIIEEENS